MKRFHQVKGVVLIGAIAGMVCGSGHGAIAAEVPTMKIAANSQIQIYGEDAAPNQPGKGYVIFQQQGTKVVGVLYYPQSEYSCFVGSRTPSQLNISSFDTSNQPAQELTISLSKLRDVKEVGASERQALSTCMKESATFTNHRFAIAEQ